MTPPPEIPRGPALRARLAEIAARTLADLPDPEASRRASEAREASVRSGKAAAAPLKDAMWAGARAKRPAVSSPPRAAREPRAYDKARRARRSAREKAERTAAVEPTLLKLLAIMAAEPGRAWLSRYLAPAMGSDADAVGRLMRWLCKDGRVRRVGQPAGTGALFALTGGADRG